MTGNAEQATDRQQRRRWTVAAVTLTVNLGSFLYLVLIARSASPAIFGALAALAGIALLFEVPANALQVALGRAVAQGPDGRVAPVAAGALLIDACLLGAGACAVLLALSPLVERFLHLPSITGALLLGAYALPVGISVVPKGVLVGQGRLRLLATGLIAGMVVRIVVGVLLVRHGGGLEGAFVAMVWGEVVTAVIVLIGLREMLRHPEVLVSGLGATAARPAPEAPDKSPAVAGGPGSTRLVWGHARLAGAAFTGYWILTTIDVVLARHWLGRQVSGWYSAAATIAQIALLAPGAIAALTFPRLVGSDIPRLVGPDSRPNQRLMFALGSAAVALTGFVAAVVVCVFAQGTVRALFGLRYSPAASVVGLLSFSSALLGLVTVLLHYHLNRGGRVTVNLCWPAMLIVIVGTSIWHHSMTEIATVMVVGTSSVCAGMLVVAWGHAEGSRAGLVERANLALLDADLDLTVVVPYYNPGKLLVPTIERLLSVLDASGATYEVIAVSDGSTDGSDRELDESLPGRPQLTNVVLAQNQGKGAALRVGLAKGHGRYLGFIDADGDLDPILLDSFQTMVGLYSPDIILGSKRHPLSEVEYPFLRRVYSWGYQQVVRIGFRLNIRDTQTGIKLIRRDVLSAVLPRMVEKRFAFDLELFVIARRLGYKRFLEAPIRLRHQFTSTVSWRSVYRSLLDTMAIWYRLRILHFYDGDQAPATPGGEGLLIDPIVLRGGAGTAAGSAGVPGRASGGGSAGTAGAGDAAAVGGLAAGGGSAAAGGGGPGR
jgi:O-antigen/teichoic acid export membrane protein